MNDPVIINGPVTTTKSGGNSAAANTPARIDPSTMTDSSATPNTSDVTNASTVTNDSGTSNRNMSNFAAGEAGDYVITTDSGCDLSVETLSEWGVPCAELTFRNTKNNRVFRNREAVLSDFYAEMRSGAVFQTSGVNPADCRELFESQLRKGKNVLHIGMSSGISVSSVSAELAAKELAEQENTNRIAVVDSLCACGGEGLLVYLAVRKKREGADFQSLVAYLKETAPKLCHWFTVDDLTYLKRGGRVKAAAAFAATVLDLKPVLHVDDGGRLAPTGKVRGRRQAIKALAEKYTLLAEEPERGAYFISHGDCLEDAALLESLILRNSGNRAACITEIGPVIGSHSGPGTLALFFIGKER